ncbi:MAG: response regulator transcription factor, partial [Sandaracinaceae bacterium]|nr:response regulator transcription factor [Sandaracinaceae bacterium]
MRVLVADDEPHARARMLRMLAKIEGVEVVAEARDGHDAIDKIALHAPDLVLLDIDMPGADGLSVAERAGGPAIVFVTAHARFAADAFEIDAYDYLLKPVSQERLSRAIDKVHKRRSSAAAGEPWRLSVQDGAVIRFVDAREVERFQATDKYTAVSYDGRELLLRESLSQLEQRLAPYGFVRVHRAELVRKDAIRAIEPEPGGALLHLASGA